MSAVGLDAIRGPRWLAALVAVLGACGGSGSGGGAGEKHARPSPSCRFDGTWVGRFDQPDFGTPYPVTIDIVDASPAKGALFAHVSYPSLACSGTWARTGELGALGTMFVVTETVEGDCADGCQYELIFDDDRCTIRGAGAGCPGEPGALVEAWSFELARR